VQWPLKQTPNIYPWFYTRWGSQLLRNRITRSWDSWVSRCSVMTWRHGVSWGDRRQWLKKQRDKCHGTINKVAGFIRGHSSTKLFDKYFCHDNEWKSCGSRELNIDWNNVCLNLFFRRLETSQRATLVTALIFGSRFKTPQISNRSPSLKIRAVSIAEWQQFVMAAYGLFWSNWSIADYKDSSTMSAFKPSK